MIVASHNQQVRLLLPSLVGWIQHHQLYSGLGADLVMGSFTRIDSARPQPVVLHRQPENSRVAAVLLMPEVTVSGVFAVVELVFSSDGLQSGVLVPSVVNPKASMV